MAGFRFSFAFGFCSISNLFISVNCEVRAKGCELFELIRIVTGAMVEREDIQRAIAG